MKFEIGTKGIGYVPWYASPLYIAYREMRSLSHSLAEYCRIDKKINLLTKRDSSINCEFTSEYAVRKKIAVRNTLSQIETGKLLKSISEKAGVPPARMWITHPGGAP